MDHLGITEVKLTETEILRGNDPDGSLEISIDPVTRDVMILRKREVNEEILPRTSKSAEEMPETRPQNTEEE